MGESIKPGSTCTHSSPMTTIRKALRKMPSGITARAKRARFQGERRKSWPATRLGRRRGKDTDSGLRGTNLGPIEVEANEGDQEAMCLEVAVQSTTDQGQE